MSNKDFLVQAQALGIIDIRGPQSRVQCLGQFPKGPVPIPVGLKIFVVDPVQVGEPGMYEEAAIPVKVKIVQVRKELQMEVPNPPICGQIGVAGRPTPMGQPLGVLLLGEQPFPAKFVVVPPKKGTREPIVEPNEKIHGLHGSTPTIHIVPQEDEMVPRTYTGPFQKLFKGPEPLMDVPDNQGAHRKDVDNIT